MTAGRNNQSHCQHWCTPQKYVNSVLAVFGEIDLDPCSNQDSIVPAKNKWILPDNNGLVLDWNFRRIFVNPPYGNGIYSWLKKCKEIGVGNNGVIALIPVAPNTKHWKDFVFKSYAVCFLSDSRVKFRINGNENNKGAPMACCMVLWTENEQFSINFTKSMKQHGNIMLPL